MNNKFKDMAVLVEFLTGSGLAILFHWVLKYHEAAYVIFGFGVLLSLATYLLREHMEKTRKNCWTSTTAPMKSLSPSPGLPIRNARQKPMSS